MKRLLPSIAILVLAGCSSDYTENRTDYGPELQEPAVVRDLCYVPAGHGTSSGTGLDMDGNLTFNSDTVEIPARYAIVFECRHGKFVIEGERAESLYKRLNKDEPVTVHYQERYAVSDTFIKGSYHSSQTNGVSLHFLDAFPSPEKPTK